MLSFAERCVTCVNSCVPSGVPLPAVGGVPVLRRAHRAVGFPRAAFHGRGHLQRAAHLGRLPRHQVREHIQASAEM